MPTHAKLATFRTMRSPVALERVPEHSPVDGFQIFTNPSSLPLASSPAIDHATSLTSPLPFPQMSGNTYVMVVYASPPLIEKNALFFFAPTEHETGADMMEK